MTTSRLIVATTNRHKISEIATLVDKVNPCLKVVGLEQLPLRPEVAETGTTFVDNAVIKARETSEWLMKEGLIHQTDKILADDSGLCVDALGGAPGIYSARFAGEGATDSMNNQKLVEEFSRRNLQSSHGYYVCALALLVFEQNITGVEDDIFSHLELFEGRLDVEVKIEARGKGGFGYDPHCWIDGGLRTVAELSPQEKAYRSHRGQALIKLAKWLEKHACE